jgi:metal-responsive CopG/Arc/MetJ family transcriptional regulator
MERLTISLDNQLSEQFDEFIHATKNLPGERFENVVKMNVIRNVTKLKKQPSIRYYLPVHGVRRTLSFGF